MKRNPYWNTTWSERDSEFYWSGVKFGSIFVAIMIPCVNLILDEVIDKIKTQRLRKEES